MKSVKTCTDEYTYTQQLAWCKENIGPSTVLWGYGGVKAGTAFVITWDFAREEDYCLFVLTWK